jgi:hypothetical protein
MPSFSYFVLDSFLFPAVLHDTATTRGNHTMFELSAPFWMQASLAALFAVAVVVTLFLGGACGVLIAGWLHDRLYGGG